ncbi:MAG: lactate utilization protein, partial [Selenomonadales bacterium]|nr:lactate utilization protein [Selenomonadales bacterium]
MAENNRNIRKEIDTKLNDPVLRGALARFAEQYPVARLKAYENVEDVDGLRNSFKAMKVDVVEHLEEIADKFEASVKARGAHFYRAKDGAALKEYLNKVCKENNVKRIIKSKS